MAESYNDDPLKLPNWLIGLCTWFWGQRLLVWSAIVLNVLLGAVVTFAFTDPSTLKKLPIAFVLQQPFVVLSLLLLLLFCTIFSGLVSRLSRMENAYRQVSTIGPVSADAINQAQAEEEADNELRQRYLRRLARDSELLTLRGIPAGLIAESVHLDEVFIAMQLRPNRPRTDYPLTEKELAYYRQCLQSGNFSKELDRVVIEAERNWHSILERTDRISIADMWQRLDDERPTAVIQGYPGMGKSTLMERLTLHMARRGLHRGDPEMPEAERFSTVLVPVLLSLGRYAAEREKTAALSLADYLTIALNDLGIAGSDGLVQKSLAMGTCLVMFDGLDEVSNPRLREEVQEAIKAFIQRYRDTPGNRFLITSRVAGYDAAAFPDYPHYTLAELTTKQIDAFLPRWCRATLRRDLGIRTQEQDEDATRQVERRVKELRAALRGNQAVSDLAENPLLLTLLAVMQQNSIVLPRQRVELYRVVTNTLLENRNIAKNLEPIPEMQAIQRLGPLAFHMQQTNNSFAHEKDVMEALMRAIEGGTDEQKRDEAKRFLGRIRERGGLFVQRTGDYFGFLHRTFQEYFAARYALNQVKLDQAMWIRRLVESARRDDALWREPFLLAVAYQSSENEHIATEILRTLLDASTNTSEAEQERDLLLAAQCIVEAKPLAIDPETEQRVAWSLLQRYEVALQERKDESCSQIEDAMRLWLLSLPKEAYRPHAACCLARSGESYEPGQASTCNPDAAYHDCSKSSSLLAQLLRDAYSSAASAGRTASHR